MKILVTGGAGFIGTNCCLYFGRDSNNSITIVDDFSRAGVDANVNHIKRELNNVQIIRANVDDTASYKNALIESDVIIHLAGQTAVTTSIGNPQLDFRSNLMGGFNLLEAVRQFNPQAILLYSSTNKVYGDLSSHVMRENETLKRYEDPSYPQGYDEQEKLDFISPYGCSKGSTDLYFQDYARIFGLSTVVFRQSCIYGPFQIGVEDQGWVAHFAKQYLFRKPITIFGNGMQVRDLLYIGDLIEAYDLAIKNISKVKGMALNIGGGISNSFSILQTINILEEVTHNQIDVSFKEERLGDQKIYISANKKIRDVLGWSPKTSFKDGVMHLLNWQRQFYNL